MSVVTLAELRAGKMNFDGKKVAPDSRQGLLTLRLREAGDDEHLEIAWRATAATVDEDVLIVASDEGKFERVPAAKTGRVYVLKLQDERRFFWSQESDEAKETELIGKFNAVLSGEIADDEFMAQDEEPDHSALAPYQPLGDWPEVADMPEAQQNELLQWMLQQISDQPEQLPLESIVTRQVLEELCDDQEISDQLKELLPEGQSVRECLLSPQFKQALGNFGQALNSEEGADMLYATLGLEIADGDELHSPVEAFLHAMVRKFGSI
jgi:26S proteasome regulatory subunit N13